ncbi:MAG: exopolysaccharide biosynthesis protein [Bdellovibrionales bacterium]
MPTYKRANTDGRDQQAVPSLHLQLHRAVEQAKQQHGLTLGSLLQALGVHGATLLILTLSLPFLLPVPLPGLSTPFGFAILILGFSILWTRPPWLPRSLSQLQIPEATLVTILNKIEPTLYRLERWLVPRLLILTNTRLGISFHGFLIMFAAFLLSLPAPPGGNIGPALSIVCFSLALLQKDGAMTALGLVILGATVWFFTEIISWGISFAETWWQNLPALM